MKLPKYWTILLLLSASVAAQAQPADTPGQQLPQSYSRQVCKTFSGEYLLYLPPGYDAQGEKAWPLLLFLHGAGERGDDFEQVKMHGPPKHIAEGREFPFIVVSPQCPAQSWWNAESLSALLDDICENYRVDVARVYVTGLSMGGFGTWDLVGAYPRRFAAIAPICGGGDPRQAARFAHVPTWAFHGDKDGTVPPQRSQEMIDAMKAAGGKPRFTVYPGVGHVSWIEPYAGTELYEWLLSHSLATMPLRVDASPYQPGKPVTIKLSTPGYYPVEATLSVAGAEPVKLSATGQWKPVELQMPADAAGAVEMTIDLGGRATQQCWLRPMTLAVPPAGQITLDGKLDDWPAESRLPEHVLIVVREGFLPEVRLAWTGEGLHLAARMDAPRLGDAQPAAFWGAPNMELFLDPAAGGKGWPASSHQFFVLPVKDGEDYRISLGEWKRSDAIAANVYGDPRLQGAMTHEDGVLTMEWFIPAEAVGAAPAAGQTWRCGMAVNASVPHHPVGSGAWPRTKDYGLLGGVQLLGEIEFVQE